ncbi:MAG: hypothetical protein VB108_05590 [Anaerolineaceae bacterium]|nr:hypothetical protein [Anaerolineaceae bacterium]
MLQPKRYLFGILFIIGMVALVIGGEFVRAGLQTKTLGQTSGPVQFYLDGIWRSSLNEKAFQSLKKYSFKDVEEGKLQEGWMASDLILVSLDIKALPNDAILLFTSSSRGKSIALSWAEVKEPSNQILFTLSGRGTIKLASTYEKLNQREEWIQDMDKVEISLP